MPVSLLLLLIITLPKDIWMLPAPSSVFMESVDMRHMLRWRPLQASCNTTVLYSVQYQGEFELEHQNGRWMDAAECQLIPDTCCDLTSDLGSDSDYNIQVGAQCGSRRSAWTKLSRPFNRRQTNLMVPKMTVRPAGGALQVSFDSLPVTSTVDVTVWKKGNELQAVVHSVPAEQAELNIADLQEGAVYCITAQTVLSSTLRSNNTAPQCVSITGPGAPPWKTPTTLTATVIVTAGLLFALFWSIVHCRPESCKKYFQKDPLPQSLRGNWDIQIPVSPQEKEPCEQMVVDVALITHKED
ncbi:interleukin-20 receptor subunit beta [Archocentrus centrarchus]|uniref:interleukin-20 receptor subunit beta n=1 Tax=Archocentrus centrarchus TaxID=63155 RepID=UPI0011EA3FFF|nr:interleukin-20 receptor subunit beta-like [Archocentrus centrarchus]